MFNLQYAALGYEQLTDLSAAVGLPDVPALATCAIIRTEAQAVRWRDDGTNPSATVGMQMLTTDAPLFYSGPLRNIKFIEVTSGAKLNISYYK